MEIVRERLEREFDLNLIATAPSVEYRVIETDGGRASWSTTRPTCPTRRAIAPDPRAVPARARSSRRPTYTGTLMDLCQSRRGEMKKMEYLSPERLELQYRMPLAEVVIDFFDQMKSRTQGYASLDYEPVGYDAADLVKVDILLNRRAGRRLLHDRAQGQGLRVRQEDGRQAARRSSRASSSTCRSRPRSAAGSSARQTVKAYRKDVTAKLYGGDITRKKKLLEKQKEGKKRMKNIGRVEVPSDAFISALRLDD